MIVGFGIPTSVIDDGIADVMHLVQRNGLSTEFVVKPKRAGQITGSSDQEFIAAETYEGRRDA